MKLPFLDSSRLPDLSRRCCEAELMDDPLSSETLLFRTLRQFAIVNRLFSRTHVAFRRHLLADIERRRLSAVSLLDLGAGGGDFALWASRLFRRRALPARIICLDNDARTIRFLQNRCRPFPEIMVVHASALDLQRLDLQADYIVSNHLLHHIEGPQIPILLATAFSAARCGLLMNDLARSPVSYLAFKCFAGIFLRRGFAYDDGLLSIRKGFTAAELRACAVQAGIAADTRVYRARFGHLQLVSIKPGVAAADGS